VFCHQCAQEPRHQSNQYRQATYLNEVTNNLERRADWRQALAGISILDDLFHCCVQDDNYHIIIQALSQHDREESGVFFELDEGDESDDVRAREYRAHVANGVNIQFPLCAPVLGIVLALVHVHAFEEAVCQEGQEHEREQGAQEAELANIHNVGEELSSPNIIAGGKYYKWEP
jgi:hypothetical protein